MSYKSKFVRQLEFVGGRDEQLQFQSKCTELIEKRTRFSKTLAFKSRWVTEEQNVK